MVKCKGREFDSLSYENKNNKLAVYGWGTWGANSCLAGQPMKSFIEFFDLNELDELLEQYPEAEPLHKLQQPVNTFDHLPDTPDLY